MIKQLNSARITRSRAFTIIEVCLIVAIIAMMLFMIVGYFLARRNEVSSPAYAPPPASTPSQLRATKPQMIDLPYTAPSTPSASPSATPALPVLR